MLNMGHINTLFAGAINPRKITVVRSPIIALNMIPYRLGNVLVVIRNVGIHMPSFLIEICSSFPVIMILVFKSRAPATTRRTAPLGWLRLGIFFLKGLGYIPGGIMAILRQPKKHANSQCHGN